MSQTPPYGSDPGLGGQQPPQPQQQVQYSPDGQYWWDGAQWQPVAGAAPVYAPQPGYYQPPQKSGAAPWVIGIVAGCGALLLISIIVIVVLTVVGRQVNNVFSNISSGLGPFPTSTP